MKSVQIPYELFVDLVLYHLNGEEDVDGEIQQGLERKLDAMLNRQPTALFTVQDRTHRGTAGAGPTGIS